MNQQTRVIALNSARPLINHPNKTISEQLAHGIYQMSVSALWPYESIPKRTKEKCLHLLESYLQTSPDPFSSFNRLCQRIIIEKWVKKSGRCSLDIPADKWLNPKNPDGFNCKSELHELLMQKHLQIPSEKDGLSILTNYYLKYILQPEAKTFFICRSKLIARKEYELVQIFYNAVVCFNFNES